MDRDPVIDALVEGFVAESREICERITGHVLALERAEQLDEAARRKHYDDLARGLHTLKGNSDTFGFPRLAELAHRMEDVVQVFRPTMQSLPAATTDVLLRAVDVFVGRLAARDKPEAELPPLDPLVAELTAVAGAARASAPPAAAAPPAATPAAAAVMPVDDELVEAPAEDWRVGPQHVEALLREVERLRELQLRIDEQKRELDRALDSLRGGGELDAAEIREVLTSLARGIESDGDEAGDIVESLEQELKAIATLPVRWILDPLQRAVRDLCRALGKEARLSCVGAELSLDRRLLDTLKGPLVHLVRNAIDHGIEVPAVRVAAGKHREGAITIRIERTGNFVFLEIEDDGGGVDTGAVRQTALARGFDDAARMDDRELYQLLFRPGFSTRREVGNVSGRGVGLDVVREVVQGLAGHIEIHSARGSGTRFVITVPATLGSTPVLVVRAGEQLFGIPMVAIETIRAARAEDVHGARTGRFAHQEQLLPLLDLGAVLGQRAPAPLVVGQPVLVVQSRGVRVVLAADELIGDRDLVVRPLPPELHDVPAYQGAATQARGDMLLVLQPDFLVENRITAPTAITVRRALVVDDSLTARALHRTILESGGYQVHTVGHARQALDHLRHAHYDVVIVDVMMEDIDGVQLTTMLRKRRETERLPIILVSSQDGSADRERGLAAGADAFLSKKECISGRLLGEVALAISRREHAP